MIFNELPIAFPWYEEQALQTRFKSNFQGLAPWGLISPKNSMLPFELRNSEGLPPTLWKIRNIETLAEINITAQISLIRQAAVAGVEYFYFAGEIIPGLDLPTGYYESFLGWGGVFNYSEIFYVPACNFSIGGTTPEFLKLEWYNDTDIAPIFYNDLDGGGIPFFRNVVYLDTFIHASEPKIEEEGERDGNDEIVITFSKAFIPYRITDMVPDYLKKAMVLMQMHDHVFLTPQKSTRAGEIRRISMDSTLEEGGAFSIINIVLEEELLIKKGCGNNMT